MTVNDTQEAILVKSGKALDVFGGGRHTLDTANIPFLNKIINLPFGGRSPFTAEVWYINKAYNLDIKWGTPTPIHIFGGLTFVEWISKNVEQLIIRPSMYFIIAVYTGINILISILYMMLFKWFVIHFIIIEIALLVIAIIFTLISILSVSSVRNSNEYTIKSVANMENITLMLDKLAISPECNDFVATIKKLKEDLKFTDISKIVPEDKEIVEVVEDLVIALITTVIAITVSSMAAYGIVRFFPKFGNIMSRVLVTTYMFPPILLAIPYSLVMAKIGLTNTRIGLIIVYLSFSVPYAVWMLVGFFKTVPIGIEEAARVDGANKMITFTRIVLPLVAPGIVATAIYTFINAWNEFLYSLILINSTNLMTVSVALKSLQGAEILDWGSMMAASTIVVIPSVIFFTFIQRYIAGGMTEGSVK